MKRSLLLLLLPVFSYGQSSQAAFMGGGSYAYSKAFGSAFGLHANAGLKAVEGVYITGGMETLRFDSLDKNYTPVTLGFLYAPQEKGKKWQPLAQAQAGYGAIKQDDRYGKFRGGLVFDFEAGVQFPMRRLAPYLKAGYRNSSFKFEATDGYYYVLKQHFGMLTVRAGLLFR